jgi:hypothetical protein
MKTRRFAVILMATLGLLTSGCAMEQGLREGLTQGVSAALSAAIQAPVNYALDQWLQSES